MERSLKSTSFVDKIFTFKVAACFSFATNDKKKVVYSNPFDISINLIGCALQFEFKYMFKSNQFCELYCLLQGVL